MPSLNQETFEENVRQTAQELTDLVQYYDQQEESGATLAAGYDPLNNLIRGLADKFRAEKNLGKEESLQEADKLVRQAERDS